MGCGRFNVESTSEVLGTTSRGCVCEVVRFVKDLQDQVADTGNCPGCQTSCYIEPLGGLVSPVRTQFDTRVFMLTTKDGTPFKAFYQTEDPCEKDCFSVYFRVEEIFDNCCATLRVLKPLDDCEKEVNLLTCDGSSLNLKKICEVKDYGFSYSCITVDLNCFCAIECIQDVYLGVCD